MLLALTENARGQDAPARKIRGIVIDAESSTPLADASIRAGDLAVLSGSDGHFYISAAPGAEITVRRLGYRPRRIRLGEQDSLVVALEPVGQSLQSVVVTAARREQRLADAVVATELISSRQLEQRGAADVAAALTDATGIQTDGGTPSGSGVLLQGLGSQRVLVLVDGQPLVGRINGNLDLSRISTTGVERIEVVKGPQSTLYGSEAMGGVINIITRRARRPGVAGELSLVAGSQGRRDAGFTLLGAARDMRISGVVDGGVRSVDLVPGRGSNSATFARRADFAPSFTRRLSTHSAVDVGASATFERQRYRLGPLYQHSDNSQLSSRLGVSGATKKQSGRLLIYASRFDHLSRRSTTPEPVSSQGERDRQTLLKLELSGSRKISHTVFDAGVDARTEAIAADRVQGRARTSRGIEPFAQSTFALGTLQIVPGLRASWSDQWGSAITPRLALMWRPVAPVAVRASVGSGFRAPDFKELYLEFVNSAAGYAVRGNPSLRPEHSSSASAGLEWTGTVGNVGVSGYRTRYTDFIDARETSTPGEYSYFNVASGRISGLDATGALGVSARRVEGSWSLLDARGSNGARLPGRARHAARLGVSLASRYDTRLSISSGFTGRTPMVVNDNGDVTRWRASRTRVDTRISQRAGRSVTLGFAVENLLDQRTGQDWPGYDGRLWSVSARLSR